MTEHPDRRTLEQFVDDELGSPLKVDVETHLESCSACRAAATDIEALGRRIALLPDRSEPERDLWPGIAARIGSSTDELSVRRSRGGEAGGTRRRPWLVRAAAIAATLLLGVALGRMLPADDRNEEVAAVLAPAPAGVLVGYEDAAYDVAVADLEGALEAMRADLEPETVAVVEANLAIIDMAIAEARQALLEDPANEQLHRHLTSTRQKKLDLLRTATVAIVNS